MEMERIKSWVATGVSRGELVLEATALEDPRLQRLLKGYCGGVLRLTAPRWLRDEADVVGFSGKLDSRFANQTGLDTHVEFATEQGRLELRATFSGFAAGWRFSQAFPDTADTLLDEFAYREVQFTLDSRSSQVLGARFPIRFGYPEEPAEATASALSGLSFQAVVPEASLPERLRALALPAPESTLTLAGPISLQDGRTKALLSAAEQGTLALTKHTLRTRLQLASVLDYTNGPGGARTAVLGGLAAELTVELDGQARTLPFLALFAHSEPYLLDFTCQLTESPPLSLEAAGLLLDGSTQLPTLPSDFPRAESVRLAGVGYEVLAATAERQYAHVTLALDQEWRPFGEWLRLFGFQLRFLMSGDALVGVTTFCKAEVARTIVEGYIRLPDLEFVFALASGERIQLKELFERTLGLSIGLPQLDCTAFSISGNVKAGDYAFMTSVETRWAVPLGPVSLELLGVRLSVACSAGLPPKPQGTLTGWFSLSGNKLIFQAHCSATTRWRFEAGTEPGKPFQVEPFLQYLDQNFGITLPPYLRTPRIDSLALKLDTGDGSFDFMVAGENSLRFEGLGSIGLSRFDLRCRVGAGKSVDWSIAATAVLGLGEQLRFYGELEIVKTGGTYTLTARPEQGEFPAGQEPRLSQVLAAVLPPGTQLPEGLPDVALSRYTLKVSSDGSGRVELGFKGIAPWRLGNASLQVRSLSFWIERPLSGDIRCGIKVDDCAGAISDDFGFQEGKLTFVWNGKEGWGLDGQITAKVFGQLFPLSAEYATDKERKKSLLRLKASTKADKPLIHIPEMLDFTPLSLALEIEKETKETRWEVSASASLKIYEHLTGQAHPLLDIPEGTLRFSASPDVQTLSFQPKGAATLSLRLLQYDGWRREQVEGETRLVRDPGRTMRLSAGLEGLKLTRDKGRWRFAADAFVELSGVPQPMDFVLERKIRGGIEVDGQGVKLLIRSLGQPLDFTFPPIQTGGPPIDLGKGAVDLRNLYFYAGSQGANGGKLEIGGELAVGLPSRLNHLFGEQEGQPWLRLFRTYRPEAPEAERDESFVRFRLSGGTDGFSGTLVNSPFIGVPFVDLRDGWLIIDLCEKKEWQKTDKDFGRVEIEIPKLALDLKEGSFSFKGGFRVDKERGLRIPLLPLQSLLKAVGLPQAAQAIPSGIPLTGLELFDQADNLRTQDLYALMERLHVPIPQELRTALDETRKVADRLPDRLKHYLNFTLPDELSMKMDVTPDGSVRINFHTSKEKPLKLLIPQPSGVLGVELSSLSFGELFGGTLFNLDLSVRIDHFDWLALAASLVLPFDQLKDFLVESGRVLRQTFFIEELFIIIVYQTGIPIPVPLFCDHLGVSYVGLEGTIVESHFHLPRPKFNAVEALTLVGELIRFFTTDQLFRLEKVPKTMNVVFTVGPNYLRLPKYLARSETDRDKGYLLGLEEGLPPLDTLKLIAVLLNAAKLRSINYLVQQTSLEHRVRAVSLRLFGLLQLDAAYALTTPAEFVEVAYDRVVKSFEANFRARNPKAPLPPATPAQEILAVVPARSSLDFSGQQDMANASRVKKDTEGVVAVIKSALNISDTVVLDTFFGLATVDGSGFGAGLSLRGQVAELVDVSLWGALMIAPKGERKLRIAGHTHFHLLRTPILEGDFEVTEQRLRFSGYLDLFPEKLFPQFPLRIYSGPRRVKGREVPLQERTLHGELDASRFSFRGGIQFELGSFALGGVVDLRAGQFEGEMQPLNRMLLDLHWGAARARLLLQESNSTLRIHGSTTALDFLGVLQVSASQGGRIVIDGREYERGPELLLEVREHTLRTCRLDGKVCFLGALGSGLKLEYQADKGRFYLEHSAGLGDPKSPVYIGYTYELAIRGARELSSLLKAQVSLKLQDHPLNFGRLGLIPLSVRADTRFLIDVPAEGDLIVKAGIKFSWQGLTLGVEPLNFQVRPEELRMESLPALAARLVVTHGRTIFASVLQSPEKWAELAAKGAITGATQIVEVLQEVFQKSSEEAQRIAKAAMASAKKACAAKTATSVM